MKRRVLALGLALLAALGVGLSLSGCDKTSSDFKLSDWLGSGPLSQDEIVKGLKTALEVGAKESTVQATKDEAKRFAANEAIRLLAPPEVAQLQQFITENASKIPGAESLVNEMASKATTELVSLMNKAAEAAAADGKTLEIFKRSITDMSIEDGLKILQGGQHSATDYLKAKTYDSLVATFTPVVQGVIGKDLTSIWSQVAGQYNQVMGLYSGAKGLPILGASVPDYDGPQSMDTDVNAYVTKGALKGLFTLVGEQEAEIRTDPIGKAKKFGEKILSRVFGSKEAKGEKKSE
ncbi:MAG: hypothetical protein CSA07_00095 [Bacteroidia bacterium]|nr:MAG: hypothetical protein CSA07_00095 [Bacteroidia bacterium]